MATVPSVTHTNPNKKNERQTKIYETRNYFFIEQRKSLEWDSVNAPTYLCEVVVGTIGQVPGKLWHTGIHVVVFFVWYRIAQNID